MSLLIPTALYLLLIEGDTVSPYYVYFSTWQKPDRIYYATVYCFITFFLRHLVLEAAGRLVGFRLVPGPYPLLLVIAGFP